MRLIDADFVLGRVKPYSADDESWAVTSGTVIRLIHNAIDNAPTIDAVPVVRCRECIHYAQGVCLKIYDDGVASSYAWQGRNPDDFCSYGERKEDGV